MKIHVRPLVAAATATVAALALGACGSSTLPGSDRASSGTPDSGSNAQSAGKADPKLRAMLPADVRSRGVLRIATDASYAPFEFIGSDGHSIVGTDPDLGRRIGALLGLKVKFSQVSFDGLIPALQSGRFDLIMAGMNDTTERHKVVDFLDYYHVDRLGMIVRKGNPDHLHDLSDLCGRTVAVQKGTTQLDWVQKKSRECAKPMNVAVFPAETDAQLQVRTGRAAADVTDYTVAAYVTSTQGGAEFGNVPTPYPNSLHGIAVAKNQTGLRDAVQQALQRLIDDGSYGALLKHWNLSAVAIPRVTLNKGTV